MGPWEAPLGLMVTVIVLPPTARWFSTRIASLVFLLTGDQRAAVYVCFLLFLPGTLLHEFSHIAAAKLLGVRTGRLQLGPKPLRNGLVQFGAVSYQRPDFVRESLIGLAPLLVGSLVVLIVASRRLGLVVPTPLVAGLPLPAWKTISQAQDAWLWLYLLLAISNAMLPSASDRRSWGIFALTLCAILAFLYVVGAFSEMSTGVVDWLLLRVRELAFAFGLTIVFDLILGVVLWLVEKLLGLLLGRRVRYS